MPAVAGTGVAPAVIAPAFALPLMGVAFSDSRRCECDSGAADEGRAGTDWSEGCHVRGDGMLLAVMVMADKPVVRAEPGGDFEVADLAEVCGDNDRCWCEVDDLAEGGGDVDRF